MEARANPLSDRAAAAGDANRRSVLADNLIVAAQIAAGYLLIECASRTFGRPGLFSFLAALSEARSRAPAVNVPEFGLAWSAMCLGGFVLIGAVTCRGVSLRRPYKRSLTLAIMATGLGVLIVGEPVQDRILAEHMGRLGYTHCASGDFYRSYGRHTEWYLHYELGASCARTAQSLSGVSDGRSSTGLSNPASE